MTVRHLLQHRGGFDREASFDPSFRTGLIGEELGLGRAAEANLLEGAVEATLAEGLRTADIAPQGTSAVTTEAMGDGVIAALEALAHA